MSVTALAIQPPVQDSAVAGAVNGSDRHGRQAPEIGVGEWDKYKIVTCSSAPFA
jgi:hypothetical protein